MNILEKICLYNPLYNCVAYNLLDPYHFNKTTFLAHDGKKHFKSDDKRLYIYFDYLIRCLLYFENRPWFIINGITDTLSQLIFYGKELELLKSKPIALYMFEPLLLVNEKADKLYQINIDKSFRSREIEYIRKFNLNNGGKLDITIYLCDYGLDKLFKKMNLYSEFKFKIFDTFLLKTTYDFKYLSHLFPFQLKKKKKIICLNFRYEPIREAIVGFLVGKQYADDCYITYYHSHDKEKIINGLGFNFDTLEEKDIILNGIEKMQKSLPFTLEVEDPHVADPIKEPIPDMLNKNTRSYSKICKFYRESFVALVNETHFSWPCAGLSEKTFYPILNKNPFIIASGPGSIKFLKELGFKTFSGFWSEKYDKIENSKKRFEEILKLINYIQNLSYDEINNIYKKMMPILEYNYNYLLYDFSRQQIAKHFYELDSSK